MNVTACDSCGEVCVPEWRLHPEDNAFEPVRDFCTVECLGLWAYARTQQKGSQLPLEAVDG